MDALSSEIAPHLDDASTSGAKARELPVSFLLRTAGPSLTARGVRREVEHGAADTLTERVSRFFAKHGDGASLIAGALPFERDRPDRLFQPLDINVDNPFDGPLRPLPTRWAARAEPDIAGYQQEVADALALIARDPRALSKVVLSRSLVMTAESAVDPLSLAARLAGDPNIACFMAPLGEGRSLVGATPELLVSKRGATVVSHPLAGSARRSTDPHKDREQAERLMASEKDRREHAWVVADILDVLSPYCLELKAPEPSLFSTRTMWHLGARIEGRLKDPSTSSIELAAALHPTPAVGGHPRDAAYQAIHELEAYDRGFYAGAVGWTGENGDGSWYVALRCAEVEGSSVRLFAGAGIVAGSDPAAEAAETSAKFQALLSALGVDETGRAQDINGK